MNYQMHFDPYTGEHLKQRDEELLREMEAQRFEERLQKNSTPRGSRLAALVQQGSLLVGKARLAQSPSPPT